MPAKVAFNALAKSLKKPGSFNPLKQSELKKILRGTKISQNPSGTISRQQYEGIRKNLIKKNDLKIRQEEELKILKEEGFRLETEKKKKNITYNKEQGRKTEGKLMAKRIEEIKRGVKPEEKPEGDELDFFKKRLEAIKNPNGLSTGETPINKKEEEKKTTLPKIPDLPPEPPDMFL